MSGRSSISVRIARLIQVLPLRLFRFLEWPFVLLASKQDKNTQAIFVLALPRSGSTVTFQSICHGLSVNYLSNLWNLCYQLPLFGGWLSERRAQFHRSEFQSLQGFVTGIDGPAEGLRFWCWWLDCGLSDYECETMPLEKRNKRANYLRRVLSVLSQTKGPFATAYLGHALVPDRVHDAFPGAVFIRLRRDPVSNALSLLKSMRSNQTTWFSVVPSECDGLERLNEYERVAAQVYWLNRRLDNSDCASEMLTVHYEKICQSPEKELSRIRNWCVENGVRVESKFTLPSHFDYKIADLNLDPEAIKIRRALDQLEDRYGKLESAE